LTYSIQQLNLHNAAPEVFDIIEQDTGGITRRSQYIKQTEESVSFFKEKKTGALLLN
jgi:hypothetical protein